VISKLLVGSCLACVISVVAAETDAARKGLVFHASFDRGLDADVAPGDPKLYWAPKIEFPAKATLGLPTNGVVIHERTGGVTGGYLRFQKKAGEMIFFQARKNIPYNQTNWNGTVSFFLKLTPDEDLEPGYTDPIQITSKSWDDAAFFVEFTKDEKPREFRLGAYSDSAVWNPQKRDWNSIPMSQKPLARVIRPPFSRDRWTHVAFTFQNFNTSQPNGFAKLYLNGEERSALTPRTQTFTWDLAKAMIMLGLSYVGAWDELQIYDRALAPDEIRSLGAAVRK
jgi:hypothetical protein